jgi:hypothetical protein
MSQPARFGLSLPALVHHRMPCPQHDPRRWPARDCRPVGRLRDLEVIDASDVLDDAVRRAVPDVDAKGEIRLGLMDKSDSTRPGPLVFYTKMSLRADVYREKAAEAKQSAALAKNPSIKSAFQEVAQALASTC